MKKGDKFHQLDARGDIRKQGVALGNALPDGTVVVKFYSWLSGGELPKGTVNVKDDLLIIYNNDEAMAAHVEYVEALEDMIDDLKRKIADIKMSLDSR
jgi:hypothetical protein